MSKVFVQKIITATIELSEKESFGLLSLLSLGVDEETLKRLGLIDLLSQLKASIKPDLEVMKKTSEYIEIATLKD